MGLKIPQKVFLETSTGRKQFIPQMRPEPMVGFSLGQARGWQQGLVSLPGWAWGLGFEPYPAVLGMYKVNLAKS